MADVYLAEYPVDESPIAFRIAAMPEEKSPLINPLNAAFITSMLTRSGVIDIQADILVDLYQSGSVMRKNVPYLWETISAVEPADTLATAVYKAQRANKVSRRIADIMHRIQQQTELQHVMLLNKDGLSAVSVRPDGELPLYFDEDFTDAFGENSLTESIARKLRLNAYVFQKELIWEPDESGGLQAVLLSEFDHHALGRLDFSGNFDHVVTVLSPEHPLRKESVPLDY